MSRLRLKEAIVSAKVVLATATAVGRSSFPAKCLARLIARAATGLASILIGAMAFATGTAARDVTLTATMSKKIGISGAYLVIYVTDADRKDYRGSLWVAGRDARYYGHFRHWWRATQPIAKTRLQELDGVTGASVANGEVLSLTLDIADELIDAGYVIRVDTSVYERRDYPSDAAAPLSTEGAGEPVAGRGYVESLTIDM